MNAQSMKLAIPATTTQLAPATLQFSIGGKRIKSISCWTDKPGDVGFQIRDSVNKLFPDVASQVVYATGTADDFYYPVPAIKVAVDIDCAKQSPNLTLAGANANAAAAMLIVDIETWEAGDDQPQLVKLEGMADLKAAMQGWFDKLLECIQKVLSGTV